MDAPTGQRILGDGWADRQSERRTGLTGRAESVPRLTPGIHGDPCVLQLLSQSGLSIATHANLAS
jgi:hypothetical protein